MPRPRDLAHERRGRLAVEKELEAAQERAFKHVKEIQEGTRDDGVSWADRPVVTAVNMKLIELAAAQERARQASSAPTAVFGVVMMQPRIESAEAWEAYAKQVAEKPQTIDVEALSAVPTEDVFSVSGSIGQIPGAIREDLREGEAVADEGEETEGSEK